MTTRIKNYSLTPASNNQPAPNGFPEGMPPAGLNDSARQVMADIRAWYEDPAWIDKGYTPVYATATTFTIVGDVTSDFIIGDRIRAIGSTPFDIIGEVTNSVFSSPNTTVTVVWDSGSIDTNLTDVLVNVGMRVPFAKMTANDITANSIKAKTADLNLKDASGNNILTVNATDVISTKPITVNGSSTEAGKIVLAEATPNGTNTLTLIAPASIDTTNKTQTLQDKTGTVALLSDIVTILSDSYDSGNQTITSAGGLTLAHGLGAIPKITQCFIKCTTAEHGYSVGDEVWMTPSFDTATNRNFALIADATNYTIRFGSTNPAFNVLNKTTGAFANITNSSWAFIVRGYA